MTVSLSISCNPLINRITDPAELVQVCAEDIGVRRIQLTNEFINPVWPAETQARLARQFAAAASRHGLRATSLMTGAQARLAAMGHSDEGVRAWTEDWFIKFGRIAADLGAASIGSQFAILSWSDWDDQAHREDRITRVLDGWCRIWEAVERFGLKEMFWEQMSIGREFGHTIPATADLVGRIEKRGIPLRSFSTSTTATSPRLMPMTRTPMPGSALSAATARSFTSSKAAPTRAATGPLSSPTTRLAAFARLRSSLR